MAHELSIMEDKHCVRLTHEDEMSNPEAAKARHEANGLLNARGWHRVVVDVTRVRTVPTSQDLFELGTSLATDLPRRARVALVVRPDQARHAKLIESLARRDGLFLTYFVQADQALAWLEGPRTPGAVRDIGLAALAPGRRAAAALGWAVT